MASHLSPRQLITIGLSTLMFIAYWNWSTRYDPPVTRIIQIKYIQDNEQHRRKQQLLDTCDHIKRGDYDTSLFSGRFVLHADHFSKVEACIIPKVGTTSWINLFNQLINLERTERTRWLNTDTETAKEKVIKKKKTRLDALFELGFSNVYLKHLSTYREEGYFSFLVVRHPLERVASAFLSKFARLNTRAKTVLQKTRNDSRVENNTMSFKRFLIYLGLPNSEDVHWDLYQNRCLPCLVHYSYIAKLETLDEDLKHILPKYHAEDLRNTFPVENKRGNTSHKDMYKDIPFEILEPVLKRYEVDAAMFGYTFDDYINIT